MEHGDALSIIIPTLNESRYIGNLIRYLRLHAAGRLQIIVADGGSLDNTGVIAAKEGARVVTCPKKGRAAQLNYGASFATGSILYFIHADCIPPANYYSKIIESIQRGQFLGRFQTKFDSNNALLKLNAFFTRFDWFICYGGDQTFFIKRDVFKKINGYNAHMLIMEDYDIVKRARKVTPYVILNGKALISARKYDTNSWIKVQRANHTIVKMFRKGASQQELVDRYKQLLDYR